MIRNRELDSVRLVCNLMVVVFHAYPFMYFTDRHFDWHAMRLVVYYFGDIFLPTLFLLSGWLFFRNFDMSAYGRKLYARVKRLLVPYVAWNAFLPIVYYGMGFFSERSRLRFESFKLHGVCDYVMAVLPITNFNPDAPTWFIRTLLIFALLSPVAYALFRFCSRIIIVGVIVVPLAFALYLKHGLWGGVNPYAVSCFFLGGWIAYSKFDLCGIVKRYRKPVICVGVVSVLASFALDTWFGIRTDDCSCGVRDVELFLASPLLLAMGPQLDRFVNKLPLRDDLIAASFFVYCGHVVAVSCFVHGMGACGFSPWLILPIAATASLFVVVLWWKLWKRISPTTLRFFDGSL